MTATAATDGSTGSYDFAMSYEADRLYFGACPVPLDRLPNEVTEADCNTGRCTSGGTGTVACGTDCNCGRCWYCESGTCRHGGEKPYGCYRGCWG